MVFAKVTASNIPCNIHLQTIVAYIIAE